VIFINPHGAPELACDHCGCRWVDRLKGKAYCYECGEEVTDEAIAEFQKAAQPPIRGDAYAAGSGD
jgi:uncharacterized Zn finger protein (UPF0148 family)